MPDCEHCGKPLKLIGADRKSGKILNNSNGKDWSGRKFHKKCYKKVCDWEMLQWQFHAK